MATAVNSVSLVRQHSAPLPNHMPLPPPASAGRLPKMALLSAALQLLLLLAMSLPTAASWDIVRVGIAAFAPPPNDVQARRSVAAAAEAAAARNADLVLLPADALMEATDTVRWLGALARTHGVALAVGVSQPRLNASSIVVLDHRGDVSARYQKAAAPSGSPRPGTPAQGTLRLRAGGAVRVGLLLGAGDLEFSEPARLLMLDATELGLVAGAALGGDMLRAHTLVRAAENLLPMAVAGHDVGYGLDCAGQLRPPCHVLSNAGGPSATSHAPPSDGATGPVTLVDFNTTFLRDVRHGNAMGDCYRRPYHYQAECGYVPRTQPRAPAPGTQQTFRVAALQMTAGKSVAENLDIAAEYCRKAAARGADAVVMPELWSVGYDALFPTESRAHPNVDASRGIFQWLSHALSVDGPEIARFRALARELRIAIAIAYMQQMQEGVCSPIPQPAPPHAAR